LITAALNRTRKKSENQRNQTTSRQHQDCEEGSNLKLSTTTMDKGRDSGESRPKWIKEIQVGFESNTPTEATTTT
jgi:hypothetical protein